MLIDTFVKGLVLGLTIAAPVGPIGLLCIQRTLSQGRKHGLSSGLGAASADAIYGTIAAFGLSFLIAPLLADQTWLRLIGGFILLYMGVRAVITKPGDQGEYRTTSSIFASYISTFVLTLSNPMTILSFAGIFAGMGLGQTPSDHSSAIILVLGVFSGSALWWLTLSTIVSLARSRVDAGVLKWINRGSGLILMGFALYLFYGLLQK